METGKQTQATQPRTP